MKQTIDIKERSFKFAVKVLRFLSTLPNEKIYWVVVDQLSRSATSIGANIHEARSASSKKDFIKYYDIALKSANESHYWIRIIEEGLQYKNTNLLDDLTSELVVICKILGASLITLKNKRQ